MSLRKRLKKAVKKTVKSVKKTVKTVQRARLKLHAQVGKVAIPVVAAVATYYGGPAAGEAVAYLGTRIQKKAYETGIRGDKSMTAHERSVEARKIANRTFKYSQIGVAAGGAVSGAVAVAGGASVTQTAGTILAGQTGSQLLGIGAQQFQAPPAMGSEEYFEAASGGYREFGEIDPETGRLAEYGGSPGQIDYSTGGGEMYAGSPGGSGFLGTAGRLGVGALGLASGAYDKYQQGQTNLAQIARDEGLEAAREAARAAGIDPGSIPGLGSGGEIPPGASGGFLDTWGLPLLIGAGILFAAKSAA